MSGLNDLLCLSGSGLNAFQSRINVCSNNIANVGTNGYSRRMLDLETAYPLSDCGSGVQTGDVTRLYNVLGQNAFLQELPNASYHAELAACLSDLESLLGGASGGLTAYFLHFERALQDAAASPENLAARTVLLQNASSLTAEINRIDGALAQAGSLWSPPAEIVDEINALTGQLQTLNREITKAEAAGRTAPDLLDRRDQLVRALTEKARVSLSPDYGITLGGQELVSADGLARQELSVAADNRFFVEGVDVTATVTGGQLAAVVTALDTAASLRDQLDTLASSLITEVNSVLDAAYNLQGERPVDLGYTFFTGTSAGNIAVDTALYDPTDPMGAHPERVALAATRASAGPPPVANTSDNVAGLELSELLRTKEDMPAGYWTQVEATLGGAVQEESELAAGSAAIVDMLYNKMLSVSGVNLDEELTNLMGAEKAYQACARIMTAADSLLETLINIGR